MLRGLVALIAAISLATPVAAAEITKLTVEERAGAARRNEPVTMGVPLPKGRVTDPRKLYLVGRGGKEVPCQMTGMAKWLDGKSLKWVLLNFRASVPAKGRAVYSLNLGGGDKTPSSGVTAKIEGDLATVNTGHVKFTVRGKSFGGFHQAWFDAGGKGRFTADTQVIAAGDRSGCVSASGGKDFFSGLDGEGRVSIERRGPMEVVVKAEGAHKDAAGRELFDYIVRFYAYANSPVVRVSHTFVCRQGAKPADCFPMDALEFVVPTRLAGGRVTAGLEDGKAVGASEILALQRTSDELALTSGGRKLGTAKGKSTKPLTTGWVDVTKKNLGLAAGVRWFWQMHPKSLSVSKDGLLKLGLYPREIKKPWDVYMGQSRTHYVTFLFHNGMAPAKLAGFFAGTQMPLMAWAPSGYYCRETACMGYIAESEKALFSGEDWATVRAYDGKLAGSIERITKKIDGHTYTHTTDSYGFYAWGDVFHWGWNKREKSPKDTFEWKLSWAGNYYDFPNAALVQFLRTGEERFLDRFIPHAMHVGDVFTCHYHPKKALWGACRYCPPRNHVALDNGRPYVSVEFNHNKSQCVFALYYLTGDLRALDNCRLLANNALTNHAADSGWAARGVGAQCAVLWCAYELWREPKYLERMKGMAHRAAAQWKRGKYRKGGFHDGIANEGMVYYLWVAPDDKTVLDALKSGVDKKGDNAARYTNMSLGNAYLYALTGEAKYRDRAWSALKRGGSTSRPKAFGLQWRNTGFALYFLSKACKPGEFRPDR